MAKVLFPLLGSSLGSDYLFSPQVDLVDPHPFMPGRGNQPRLPHLCQLWNRAHEEAQHRHTAQLILSVNNLAQAHKKFRLGLYLNQHPHVTGHCSSHGVSQQGNSSCSSQISSQQDEGDSSQSFTTIKSCPSPKELASAA